MAAEDLVTEGQVSALVAAVADHVSTGTPGAGSIDGGTWDTNYGGTTPIDGGTF